MEITAKEAMPPSKSSYTNHRVKELTAAAKATATAPIWTMLIGTTLLIALDVLE